MNKQIAGSNLESKTLVEVIKESWNNGSPTPVFNNAAQVCARALQRSQTSGVMTLLHNLQHVALKSPFEQTCAEALLNACLICFVNSSGPDQDYASFHIPNRSKGDSTVSGRPVRELLHFIRLWQWARERRSASIRELQQCVGLALWQHS